MEEAALAELSVEEGDEGRLGMSMYARISIRSMLSRVLCNGAVSRSKPIVIY